jgi:hypothetical protein
VIQVILIQSSSLQCLSFQKFYENYQEAFADVITSKLTGILHFHSNFSDSIHNLFDIDSGEVTIGSLDAHLDNSLFLDAHTLRIEILKACQKFLEKTAETCGWNSKSISLPINIETVYGKLGFNAKTLDSLGVLLM